jgi:DNA invertase Pin-like site-specific DNA recombinase
MMVLHDHSRLISALELCQSLGIDFVSITEALDTSVPAGEMLFQMISAVAQFERSLIGERVRAGIGNGPRERYDFGSTSVVSFESKRDRQPKKAAEPRCATFRLAVAPVHPPEPGQ